MRCKKGGDELETRRVCAPKKGEDEILKSEGEDVIKNGDKFLLNGVTIYSKKRYGFLKRRGRVSYRLRVRLLKRIGGYRKGQFSVKKVIDEL